MIREYFGLLGAGKTMNMTYDAMWWLKKGMRVVSNYEIAFCSSGKPIEFQNAKDHPKVTDQCKYKGDHFYSIFYEDAEEYLYHIVKDWHTLFVIDEASIIFPRRVKVPRAFIHKFLQNRKDACNLYYTAQIPKKVFDVILDLTNETVRCNFTKAFGILSEVPYLTTDKDGKRVWKKTHSLYSHARWYNTNIIQRKMNFYDRKGRDRAWRHRILSPSICRVVHRNYDTLYKVNYAETFRISKPKSSTSQETTSQGQSIIRPNIELIAEAHRALAEARSELGKGEHEPVKQLFRRSAFYNQD